MSNMEKALDNLRKIATSYDYITVTYLLDHLYLN